MKKKVFSKLLMVALVATVGVFSSCKDYDDDIADVRNNLSQTATELRTDYTNKISLVNNSITELTKSLANLDEAYKAADAKLKADLTTDINSAVAIAKAYSDANLDKAYTAAQAAQAAAAVYTDQQRAAAEAAALAAAKDQVAAAKAELQAALSEANKLIATQGETITNLLKADELLTSAIADAQTKANQAYDLAVQANNLAEQNATAVKKAAADIATLQTELGNVKTANAADITKLQSDLAALQKQVSENVVNLADYNTNLTQTTSDLAKLKENLDNQVSLLGESIAAVKKTADENFASITAINKQLLTLQEADKAIEAKIVESVNALNTLIENNKNANDVALENAVKGIEAKLAALQTLIESNDAAIRALIDTKASELKALIDGNTAAIVKNAQDIEKNAEALKAENVLRDNKISKNAEDIIKQGKDITNLQDVVTALQTALGKETAATLKAYAEKVAEDAAGGAYQNAKDYADEQNRLQNITIMEAIAAQAAQDKEAWEKAIGLAVETLEKTFGTALLKNLAEAKEWATGQAQEYANKALQDANTYTDLLAKHLKDNYTQTGDMNAAILAAQNTAYAQAYRDVLNALLRDYDEWYNLTDDKKTYEGENAVLPITIMQAAAKAAKEYVDALGLSDVQGMIDATIAKELIATTGTGTYEMVDGVPVEIMKPGGKIMVLIEAARDLVLEKLNGVDLRLQDVEKFLGATVVNKDTLLQGEIFKASVNALILEAKLASQASVDSIKAQLAGTIGSELLTKIEQAQADATQNGEDIEDLQESIKNVNTKFVNFIKAPAEDASSEEYEAESHIDKDELQAFEANIGDLVDRVNYNSGIINKLDSEVKSIVNKYLSKTVNNMVTSVNLFYNQHVAYNDDDVYGFDHNLDFIYVIEENNKFPMDDYEASDIDFNQAKYVDGQVVFKKGTLRTYGDKILVRVNPVNATFTKEQVALINSKKEDIVGKGIVEVTGVERYVGPNDGADYITRSAEEKETGLWVISFKLCDNEGQTDAFDNFKKAATTKINNEDRQILYAVGIKNVDFTPEKAEEGDDADYDRYVVSEYDLGLNAEPADHSWNFDVNDETVAKIHNRYIVNENKPNEGEELWTNDKENFEDSYWDEFTYIYDYVDPLICESEEDQEGGDNLYYDENGNIIYTYPGYTYDQFVYTPEEGANVTNRYKHTDLKKGGYMTNGIDNRHDFAIKVVNFDQDGWANIKIKFPKTLCGRHTDIKAFYVTLDQNFARESTTSEVSAWTGYIYDGVGFQTVNGFDTKTGKYRIDTERNDPQLGIENGIRKATLFVKDGSEEIEGTIRVKDARGAKGDIIGFRVFAVNLDGTLYDPDGRAFYVKLGDAGEEHELNFEVEVKNNQGDAAIQKEDIVAYNTAAAENGENPFFNMFKKEQNKGGKYFYEFTWDEENPVVRGTQNEQFMPIASTTGYSAGFYDNPDYDLISELFQFSYTNDNPADVKAGKWEIADTKGEIPAGSSILRFLYEGNPEIQNVKVTLKSAVRLVDNATYNMVLKITLKDSEGAESVVNTIKIHVTKKMPTTLPDEFAVRVGQEGFAKDVDFFLRAYRNTQKTWTINDWFKWDAEDYGKSVIDDTDDMWYYRWAYDARPYNFEEIFVGLIDEKGVFDENYKFVFPGCGDYTKDKDGVGADAISTFRMYPDADVVAVQSRWNNKMTYTGLNTDKQEATLDPGYYLPYVHYEVIETQVPVKAGYFYRGISYNPKDADQVDYEVPADYFDADGNFVSKDKAAFVADFRCAITHHFTANDHYGVIAYNGSGNVDTDHDGVGTLGANGTSNKRDQKWIPYGNKFILSLDSVHVDWKSDLGTYTKADETPSASYFKTNFNQVSSVYTVGQDDTDEKAAFYKDELATLNPLEKEGYLYSNVNQNQNPADYLRVVGMAAPKVSKVVIYSAKSTNGKLTILATLEGDNLAKISDYFNVSQADARVTPYGLLFEPKVNSLNPTEVGKFEITVECSKPLELKHQWCHSNPVTDVKKTITVYNPKANPEAEEFSRQAR